MWRVEGADGVKTGYTRAAGRILVSSAQRQGRRLVAVTIDDGNDWADHASLYELGFREFQVRQVLTKGQTVGQIAVFGGAICQVGLVADEDFHFALTAAEEPIIRLSPKEFVFAPVAQGQEAGYAYICIGDKTVGKVLLRYDQTIELQPAQKQHFWQRWFGE